MMGDLVRRPFAVHHNYTNPVIRQRAHGLLIMSWATILGVFVFLVRSAVPGLTNSASNFPLIPSLIAAFVVLVVAIVLIQTGRLEIAIWLFLIIQLVPLVPAVITTATNSAVPGVLVIPLVTAGILLRRRGLLIMIAIVAITLVLRLVYQGHVLTPVRYIPADNALSELVNYGFYFGLSSIFLLVFSGRSEYAGAASVSAVERLQITLRFNERLQNASTESEVLTRVLELLQADLGYDLAQFYLSDDTGHYTRRVRLGLGQSETGTRVTLRPSDESVITEAVTTRMSVIVTAGDQGIQVEHLIAPARQSMTLALVYNDNVRGVLDVQSERSDGFDETSINALHSLTSLTARELAQVHRIDELERNVRDQESIINRFLNQMTELQQRTQTVAGTSWSRYLQGRAQGGFGFDYEGGNLLAATDLPDEIRQAVQQGDIFVAAQDGAQQVNVPILLRNQVLGALTFTIPGERSINERQIEMLRTIASRLGIALESNRLLEQTQAQAQRERKANEISSLLLSVTDVDDVLDLAANNFNEALGAVRTRVYIEPGALTASGEQS